MVILYEIQGIHEEIKEGPAMNLFELPLALPDEEVFETLWESRGVLVERIISRGQASPPDFWYDQLKDEWVVLIQGQARLRWEDGSVQELAAGDAVMIPAHVRHRVDYTSTEPPCIWLAIHAEAGTASRTKAQR